MENRIIGMMRYVLLIVFGLTIISCTPRMADNPLDQQAAAYEASAKISGANSAAIKWYKAGRLWVDPANKQASTARALTAFRKVDQTRVSVAVARETKSWISVLGQLVSARESAADAQRARRQAEHEVSELESVVEDISK